MCRPFSINMIQALQNHTIPSDTVCRGGCEKTPIKAFEGTGKRTKGKTLYYCEACAVMYEQSFVGASKPKKQVKKEQPKKKVATLTVADIKKRNLKRIVDFTTPTSCNDCGGARAIHEDDGKTLCWVCYRKTMQ